MKSIRVNILGRDYALRVRDEAEDQTRELARFVERRMRQFKEAHPEQAELTTAVITALTLAEELHDLQAERDAAQEDLDAELDGLADRLADVLSGPRNEGASAPAPASMKHDEA
ncbi:MAG: cell division protein ZapA [Bacteroidetes bacterium]|jgi:cell division protein ZapA|nr:cell division protein ZapA [Bacteroidota bacterium]